MMIVLSFRLWMGNDATEPSADGRNSERRKGKFRSETYEHLTHTEATTRTFIHF